MECSKCGNEIAPFRGFKSDPTQCVRCLRESDLDIYFQQLNISKVFHKARIDDFKRVLSAHDTSGSVFVYGPAGVGKTHLAVALCIEDILSTSCNVHSHIAFTSMLNLLASIKSTFSKKSLMSEEQLIDFYCNVPNLYIDDIGVEQVTDWSLARVYQIIDYRWGNQLRTIFTSNFDLNAISEKMDSRIASRIEGMSEIIELTGRDRRRK